MKVPISGSRSRSPSQYRATRSRISSPAITTDIPSRASQEPQRTCAVDLDGSAGEEADVARAQERGHAPEVLGVAQASPVPQLFDAIGRVQPRTEEVQRDPLVDQIFGRRLGPGPEAGPRGVRIREVGDRLFDRLRGDEHDPAPAGRAQVWERGPDEP